MFVVSHICCCRDPEKVDSRVADLQQRLTDSDRQKHEQLEALRKKHQTEIDDLRKQQQQPKVVKLLLVVTGVFTTVFILFLFFCVELMSLYV